MENLQIIKKYAPELYFDRNEPFFPDRIGVSILRKSGPSPSFDRSFHFDQKDLDYIIEYAIFWDFDIQHLYDLEHVWMYIAKDGSVLDCEGSFHGNYLKGLLKDRTNLNGTHVKLYAQPGKHALSPRLDLFELIPDLSTCTYEDAGKTGLLVTQLFKGILKTDDEIDKRVQAHLQHYRFKPAMECQPFELTDDLFVNWVSLKEEIPNRIHRVLQIINP